jgi:hypothetical protein
MGVTDTRIELPYHLHGVFFDRLWETSKVWRLPTEAQALPLENLRWQLDLRVWTTVPGETRWDLSPRMVLRRPHLHARHWKKILSADLTFPLEMFRQDGRWVVLDGYHRLARHDLEEREMVLVRLHPDDCWPAIVRES